VNIHTEQSKNHCALDVRILPLMSSDFVQPLCVLPYFNDHSALLFYRNVFHYLSIRHLIYFNAVFSETYEFRAALVVQDIYAYVPPGYL
jgi:hypothetical protein